MTARKRNQQRNNARQHDGHIFTIAIDTREQKPYTFARIPYDRSELSRSQQQQQQGQERGATAGQPPAIGSIGGIAAAPAPIQYHDVSTAVTTLQSGDYSLVGYESQIAIERKSKEDLYSTLAQGRDRFEREIDRLNSFQPRVIEPKINPFACVLVEAEWSDIIRDPPKHSKLIPKSILRTVIAWQQRYINVHWFFVPGREIAEVIAFRMLQRWWIDNVERNVEQNVEQEKQIEQEEVKQ